MKAERKAVLTFLILAVSGFLLSAYGYLLLGKLTVTTEEIVTVQPITVNVQPSSSGSDSYSNVITFDYTRGGFEGGEEVLIRCELLLNDTKIFQAFRSLAVEIQDPDRNLNITCLTLANPVKEFVATVPSPPSAKSYNVTVIWQSTDNPPSQVELNIDAKVVVIGTTLWLNGWTYRKRHEIICSPAESVTNYQIRFVVHYGSGTDNGENVYLNGKCQPDFDDLRFTTEDQKVLSYWIEEKVDGDYAVVWVKIPDIPESPGKTTIYLYYGNPTATTVSNIKATFVRGDDFNDGVLDPMWTEWDKRGRGVSVTEENGYVEIVNLGIFSEGGIYVDLPSTMSSLVVECKFMIPVRDTIEGFDVILQHAAETPPETYHDVYWDWHDRDDRYRIVEEGIAEDIRAYVEGSPPTTSFWKSSFTLNGTSAHLVVPEGSVDISGTLTETKTVNYVYLQCGTYSSGVTVRVDDFRVRKYIYPEPSHGAWGPEEVVG